MTNPSRRGQLAPRRHDAETLMTDGRPYLIALAVGLLVGVIYALVGVRSPAPPVVALVGLLGILLGEQLVPVAKRIACGAPVTRAWLGASCGAHVLGQLPGSAPASRPDDGEAS
jgi:XapX domain-containing protein